MTKLEQIVGMETSAGSILKNVNRPSQAELKKTLDLYLKYFGVLEELNEIYAGMVHPQMRSLVMETQSLIITRLIQLRNFFYNNPYYFHPNSACKDESHKWEFMNLSSDLFSTELKYKWCRMQAVIPKFIQNDAQKTKADRDALVNGYINHYSKNTNGQLKREGDTDNNKETANYAPGEEYESSIVNDLTTRDLCNDITTHEMNGISEKAVLILQRYTRGHLARARSRWNADWIRVFLGMMNDGKGSDSKAINNKRLFVLNERKEFEQSRNELDYGYVLENLRKDIKREKGVVLTQDLKEERIQWVAKQIASTHKIPRTFDEFYELSSPSAANAGVIQAEDREDGLISLIKDDINKFKLQWVDEESAWHSFIVKTTKDTVVKNQVLSDIQDVVDKELLTNLLRTKTVSNATASRSKSGENGKQTKSRKGKKEKDLPGNRIEELKNMSNMKMLDRLARYRLLEIPRNKNMKDFVCSTDQNRFSKLGADENPSAILAETKRVRFFSHIFKVNIES